MLLDASPSSCGSKMTARHGCVRPGVLRNSPYCAADRICTDAHENYYYGGMCCTYGARRMPNRAPPCYDEKRRLNDVAATSHTLIVTYKQTKVPPNGGTLKIFYSLLLDGSNSFIAQSISHIPVAIGSENLIEKHIVISLTMPIVRPQLIARQIVITRKNATVLFAISIPPHQIIRRHVKEVAQLSESFDIRYPLSFFISTYHVF